MSKVFWQGGGGTGSEYETLTNASGPFAIKSLNEYAVPTEIDDVIQPSELRFNTQAATVPLVYGLRKLVVPVHYRTVRLGNNSTVASFSGWNTNMSLEEIETDCQLLDVDLTNFLSLKRLSAPLAETATTNWLRGMDSNSAEDDFIIDLPQATSLNFRYCSNSATPKCKITLKLPRLTSWNTYQSNFNFAGRIELNSRTTLGGSDAGLYNGFGNPGTGKRLEWVLPAITALSAYSSGTTTGINVLYLGPDLGSIAASIIQYKAGFEFHVPNVDCTTYSTLINAGLTAADIITDYDYTQDVVS